MQTNKSSFIEFLEKHKNKRAISFHMPGHKGSAIFERFGYKEFFNDLINMDITEINGADNLFQAEGIIADLEEEYKELYGSKASYLLVNGSSSGLEAAILTAVSKGGQMVVARNCHKSIYNALELGAIEPVYAFPNTLEEYGIASDISPSEIERCIWENPAAEAVIIPSPNYYGICSDIKSIADICHAHGKILIVDEAHGAHLKFFGDEFGVEESFPKSAEDAGADAVVVSAHKTLASFTQSAVLNIMTDRIDLAALCGHLAQFQSTSPSYILMASLAVNAQIIKEHKKNLLNEWKENLEFFYESAKKIKGLKILKTVKTANIGSSNTEKILGLHQSNMENPIEENSEEYRYTDFEDRNCIELFDKTKINIDMSYYGYDGNALEERLIAHNIYPELVSGNLVMCMTGIGNKLTDYQALLTTLYELAAEATSAGRELGESMDTDITMGKENTKQKKPQKAKIDNLKKTKLKLPDAIGLPCVYPVIPYPPGIPVVCPGEILNEDMARQITALRQNGKKVLGVDENLEIWCYLLD